MNNVLPAPNSPSQKAIQYFLAIITILLIGKLISMIPVMSRLQIAGTYKAAEIVWFCAKISALALFYYFARFFIAAVPNNGSFLSFLRNIAAPLTILLIVILGQELLWQILAPFVHGIGKKIYFSLAILLIIAISIWLVVKAYQSALYLLKASEDIAGYLSLYISSANIICSSCGSQVMKKSLFCNHCGIKMGAQSNCAQCGATLLGQQKFCRHCGAEAKEKTATNEQEQ